MAPARRFLASCWFVLLVLVASALVSTALPANNRNANSNSNRRVKTPVQTQAQTQTPLAEVEADKHHLDSGHCKAICLENYISVLENMNVTVDPRNLMDSCSDNIHLPDCSACLRGCELDNSGLPLDCATNCGNNSVCIRSCILVHDLYYYHPGSCPSAQALSCNVTSDFALAAETDADEECQNDGDCREWNSAKCCVSSCGRRMCTASQPVRPPRATIASIEFQENPATQDQINLEWTAAAESSSSGGNDLTPIVFVLQLKRQFGNDDSEKQWITIAEDTKTAAQIENIPKCQKYQYRVAAVTPYTRGAFSPASRFIGSDKQPNAPGKPLNVEISKVVLRGNVVDLELKWNPPSKSDLPIRSYEVSWVKRMRTPESAEPSYSSVQKHRTLKPNELSCTISDLEKDEDFKISIIAVSICGWTPLESEPTIIFHRTAVTSPNTLETDNRREESAACPAVAEQSLTYVSMVYDNDLVAELSWSAPRLNIPISSYRVEWRMVSCLNGPFQQPFPARNQTSTRNTYVSLPQLAFTCEYEFQVRTFGIDNSCHLLARKQFRTPTCTDVQLAPRATPPLCAPTGVLSPPPPGKISVQLSYSNNRFEALVAWGAPAPRRSGVRYRVLFGKSSLGSPSFLDKMRFRKDRFILSPPTLPPLFDHTLDRNNALTNVVTSRNVSLTDLEPNAVYVVHVQTLEDDFYSRPIRAFFATLVPDTAGSDTRSKTRPATTRPTVRSSSAAVFRASRWSVSIVLVCLTVLLNHVR